MRLESGMPSLRSQIVLATFKRCLWRACQGAVRILHFSLQRDHIHLVVEAPDRPHLGRSMRGFASGFARRLNGLRGSRGRVFADRYHRHDLKTPREVRNALVYVIQNGLKHAGARLNPESALDPFSSAAFFDGWASSANVVLERLRAALPPDEQPPVAKGRFWLTTVGWKRLGLLSLQEQPRIGA
jgi:REP element-mobilizing transposase RayT